MEDWSSREWTWDVQFCVKTFTTDRGTPTYQRPILTHSMEVQTFTTDRGPSTFAMSIASSKLFCPPLISSIACMQLLQWLKWCASHGHVMPCIHACANGAAQQPVKSTRAKVLRSSDLSLKMGVSKDVQCKLANPWADRKKKLHMAWGDQQLYTRG